MGLPVRVGRRVRHVVLVVLFLSIAAEAAASQRTDDGASGRDLFRAGCASCHGVDGRGAPPSVVAFDTPLPDFTDCTFASREAAADWFAIAHEGGPVRGFNRRMPAFGDALTGPELERTIEYVRSFCADQAWPRGELNLPRALVTEKAFPEDEAVLTTTIGTGSARSVTNEFLYERRFGARSQIEVSVPMEMARGSAGAWTGGLGDAAVAFKHALVHSSRRGSIFSLAGEVILPTGKEDRGLGSGFTTFEPFVAFGQILPANAFLQVQAGAEIPMRETAAREAFWRSALGTTFQRGFGRAWSPIVELLGARELESGQPVEWDIVPQMQVTLSKRQHIMISGGVRVPMTQRDDRHAQVMTYFLWDWFDGGLREGW